VEPMTCGRCVRWYGEDPALIAMRERVPGSMGYRSATSMWTGEPCACPDGPLRELEADATGQEGDDERVQ